MLVFKVNYSLEKDALNYLSSLWKLRYLKHGRRFLSENLSNGFPNEFIRGLKAIDDKPTARKYVSDYLRVQHPFFREYINRVQKRSQNTLNEEASEIALSLEKVYGLRFPFNQIGVYITTLKICPYDYPERWFMISVYGDPKSHLNTALHELNHFMFYYYFGKLRGELGHEKFESLKEALTVFTNPDEEGYPAQRRLRAWLARQKGTISEIIREGKWEDFSGERFRS